MTDAEFADLKERVKRLEIISGEDKKAVQLEMRGGFQMITGRLGSIEAELTMSMEPRLERLESKVDRIEARLERLETFLREKLNGGDRH